MVDALLKRFRYGYFSHAKQKAFLEDLSTLVEDGVPVSQAIETIRQVSDGITERVATRITNSLAQGKQLADGMQSWFSRPLVETIRAGEISGTLAKTLKTAAYSFSQQTDAIKSFLTTLIYPLLVLTAAFLLIVFIKHSVLDSFAAIQPIAQWPDIGQDLYRLGFLIEHWWWLAILLVVMLIYFTFYFLQQFTGDMRSRIDNILILSLYRDMTAARFMETLGLLISNGVVLKKALSIMHREAAPYLSWHILKMEFRLSGGKENMADVLDTKLIHRNDIVRLRIVAKSKGFEQALIHLGQQANKRVTKTIVLAGKISGGLLLMFGALMAATVVFGIYSVGSSIAT